MSNYFSVVSTMAIVDEPKEEIKEKIRYMSIDVFRGLVIAAMIFVNMATIRSLQSYKK